MAARTGKAKLAGVLGAPVGHSLSPALHEYWLRRYDIDGAYIPLEAPAEAFSDILRSLSLLGFRGMNATIPHKERSFAAVADMDEAARLTGAVNTLIRREDGSYYGKNTDVHGFLENLRQHGVAPENLSKAVILGAGGAARGIAAGLALAGCTRLILTNRTEAKAQRLAEQLISALPQVRITVQPWEKRAECLAEADLLVNTTQLGMRGQPPLELDLRALPLGAAVSDIIYNPLKTALLEAAEQRGNRIVGGLGMLLHQAAPGFEAWFGVTPEVTPELYDYIASLIAP